MSVPTTTIINTVTLSPGEQFVLPPSATLLATSDEASLTSSCDIPELEEYACYVFALGVPGSQSPTGFGSEVHTNLLGYEMDGRLYPVPGGYITPVDGGDGSFNTTSLIQALRGIVNSGYIIVDCVSGTGGDDPYSDPSDRGAITYIVFRTIPSIAAKLKLKMSMDAPIGVESRIYYYVTPQLRTDAATFGYIGMCDCENSGGDQP